MPASGACLSVTARTLTVKVGPWRAVYRWCIMTRCKASPFLSSFSFFFVRSSSFGSLRVGLSLFGSFLFAFQYVVGCVTAVTSQTMCVFAFSRMELVMHRRCFPLSLLSSVWIQTLSNRLRSSSARICHHVNKHTPHFNCTCEEHPR